MDKILVLDFGGQYNQLIARRVRNFNVFAEIFSYNKITIDEIKKRQYKGIIFTGGPNSVYDEKSPHYDKEILNVGIPILGICYGCQLIAFMGGGKVANAKNSSEYGKTNLYIKNKNVLFDGVIDKSICWMSHNDFVSELPYGFMVNAITDNCPMAAMSNEAKNIYAVQFHPEVLHTEYGMQILNNFVFKICKCEKNWLMDDFIEKSIDKYKKEIGDKKVLLALSGGVDSTVTAVLLNKAIGKNLVCVFVDHGLLRKNERQSVEKNIRDRFDINLIVVDAVERFLGKLKGIVEPEKKRKIIGEEFIRVFEEEAKKIGGIDYLAQGTIYPDVVESGRGDSAIIKSHHNVGGLPKDIGFKGIIEPLRDLFKDEVRIVGEKLGIDKSLVWRQPFPGPGLAVRVIGEITNEKLDIVREADNIFCSMVDTMPKETRPNQYFAAITDLKSVGVKGDARTYGYTLVLRAVSTDDFMTATWTKIPYNILDDAANKIVNEIADVTRVVYDITSKPPATVEWE